MNGDHELFVPYDGNGWINSNQRIHWRPKAARTKAWRQATAWYARQAKIPHIPAALIVCELRFSTAHRRDPANWAPTAKACVDGLVDAGVFDDDDHKHVTGPDMRIGKTVPAHLTGLVLHIYPKEES